MDIINFEDHKEFTIINRKGIKFKILVSTEDQDLLEKYKWYINGGYACRKVKTSEYKIHTQQLYLHRVVAERMGLDLSQEIDHINLNKLDNRRTNLRFCTVSQNHYNTRVKSNNSSGYKGVSWHKRSGRWQAQIRFQGQLIALGYYQEAEQAYEAYCSKARELAGDYIKI